MHYDRHYLGGHTPENDKQAIKDAKEYWGRDARRIEKVLKSEEAKAWTQRDWEIALSFSGVQGFPVVALYEHYTGKKWEYKNNG